MIIRHHDALAQPAKTAWFAIEPRGNLQLVGDREHVGVAYGTTPRHHVDPTTWQRPDDGAKLSAAVGIALAHVAQQTPKEGPPAVAQTRQLDRVATNENHRTRTTM